MKKLIAVGALLTCLGVPAMAGGEGWTSDFEAAKKQAVEGKKDLLMDFTGSDWCIWCTRLHDEVFSKDAFKSGVKDKFVLVELDFPRDTSKVTPEVKARNEKLRDKYMIQGYPTIVLSDAKGLPYATTGYRPNGPEKYVESLDKLIQTRVERDKAFEKAKSSEGVEKAKALYSGIKAMKELPDEMMQSFYGNVIEEIKKLDPKDETGLVKKENQAKKLEEIGKKAVEMLKGQDFDGAMTYLDKAVKEAGFEGEVKQEALAMKILILANQGKLADAITMLDEIKKIAPDSDLSENLDGLRDRLGTALKRQQAEQASADKKAEEKAPKEPAKAPEEPTKE
jgi:thioredoxin-related protein